MRHIFPFEEPTTETLNQLFPSWRCYGIEPCIVVPDIGVQKWYEKNGLQTSEIFVGQWNSDIKNLLVLAWLIKEALKKFCSLAIENPVITIRKWGEKGQCAVITAPYELAQSIMNLGGILLVTPRNNPRGYTHSRPLIFEPFWPCGRPQKSPQFFCQSPHTPSKQSFHPANYTPPKIPLPSYSSTTPAPQPETESPDRRRTMPGRCISGM